MLLDDLEHIPRSLSVSTATRFGRESDGKKYASIVIAGLLSIDNRQKARPYAYCALTQQSRASLGEKGLQCFTHSTGVEFYLELLAGQRCSDNVTWNLREAIHEVSYEDIDVKSTLLHHWSPPPSFRVPRTARAVACGCKPLVVKPAKEAGTVSGGSAIWLLGTRTKAEDP
jgi:hypothetical protein